MSDANNVQILEHQTFMPFISSQSTDHRQSFFDYYFILNLFFQNGPLILQVEPLKNDNQSTLSTTIDII